MYKNTANLVLSEDTSLPQHDKHSVPAMSTPFTRREGNQGTIAEVFSLS